MSLCETLDYSAGFFGGTPSVVNPGYSALPPFASPSQSIRLNRDLQMKRYLTLAIERATDNELTVSQEAYENFSRFLQLLPEGMPVTDPYVTESGSICLDWDDNPQWQLSILLKNQNRVSFAAYFSGEKVNGSADFSRSELPAQLLATASRWISRDGRPAEGKCP